MTIYVVSAVESFHDTCEMHPLIPQAARTRTEADRVLRKFIASEISLWSGRDATPEDVQDAIDDERSEHVAMYDNGDVHIEWEIDQVEVEESEE